MKRHITQFSVFAASLVTVAAQARHIDFEAPVVYSSKPFERIEYAQSCEVDYSKISAESQELAEKTVTSVTSYSSQTVISQNTFEVKAVMPENAVSKESVSGKTVYAPEDTAVSDGVMPNRHLTWIIDAMQPKYCSTLYSQLAKVREYDERGESVPASLENRIRALVSLEYAREKFIEEHTPSSNTTER